MDIQAVKKEIIKIVTKHIELPHYKIFLFGSRVNGKADNRSDIDVGVEAEAKIPAAMMLDVKEELDNLPILQKIDFVDFCDLDEDFKRVASKEVEVIYER